MCFAFLVIATISTTKTEPVNMCSIPTKWKFIVVGRRELEERFGAQKGVRLTVLLSYGFEFIEYDAMLNEIEWTIEKSSANQSLTTENQAPYTMPERFQPSCSLSNSLSVYSAQ